jgi:hypothetical protein
MSEDNKTLILREFEELKGQFIITASQKINRLIAVGEDDSDYYWITYDGRRLYWHSCVGRIMPLKGHLRDEDYNELVRLAKLNHYDQTTLFGKTPTGEAVTFSGEHKRLLTELGENERFLSEIHWEIV